MTPSTPKTFLFLARQAPGGIVFYRRSHKTTYVLRLTARDALKIGSRFYGRLFPERCDLSPDGKLLVYFAMRGKRSNGKSDPATWTAVCEPPSLTALLFCPNGSTWGGGGLFMSGKRLAIFDTVPEDIRAVRDYEIMRNFAIASDEDVARLRHHSRAVPDQVFPCPIGDRRNRSPNLIRYRKKHVASGYDMFDYVLRHPDGRDVEGAEDVILADWAGWDFAGRLVVAAGRHIKFYGVRPGKPLQRPTKTIDIEAAIA